MCSRLNSNDLSAWRILTVLLCRFILCHTCFTLCLLVVGGRGAEEVPIIMLLLNKDVWVEPGSELTVDSVASLAGWVFFFLSLSEHITVTDGLLTRPKCLWAFQKRCQLPTSWTCLCVCLCLHGSGCVSVGTCVSASAHASKCVCMCVSWAHSQLLAVLVRLSFPPDAWLITSIIVIVPISTRGSQDSLALRASRVCQGSQEPRWVFFTWMCLCLLRYSNL